MRYTALCQVACMRVCVYARDTTSPSGGRRDITSSRVRSLKYKCELSRSLGRWLVSGLGGAHNLSDLDAERSSVSGNEGDDN